MATTLLRHRFVQLGSLVAASALSLQAHAAESSTAPYTLPDLPYAADALEPHIDAKTMEIHHGKHHAAYVKNLNDALQGNDKLSKLTLGELQTELPDISDKALQTTVRNNAGGHWNHAFFWSILAPEAQSGEPSPELKSAIEEQFKSWDEFKNEFGAAAAKRFGSGWAWLVVQDGKLKIVSTANQDNPLMKGTVDDDVLGTPILGLDVWEHAYYLNYQNRRPDYVASWWSVINWPAVSALYAEATK